MSGHEAGNPRIIEGGSLVRCEHRSIKIDERQRGTQHSGGSLAGGDDGARSVFGMNLRERRGDQRTGSNGIDTRAQDAQCVAA